MMLPLLLTAKYAAVQDIEVAFRGIEMGSLEALLKAASPEYRSRPYSSGLEDSAAGGEYCSSLPTRVPLSTPQVTRSLSDCAP